MTRAQVTFAFILLSITFAHVAGDAWVSLIPDDITSLMQQFTVSQHLMPINQWEPREYMDDELGDDDDDKGRKRVVPQVSSKMQAAAKQVGVDTPKRLKKGTHYEKDIVQSDKQAIHDHGDKVATKKMRADVSHQMKEHGNTKQSAEGFAKSVEANAHREQKAKDANMKDERSDQQRKDDQETAKDNAAAKKDQEKARNNQAKSASSKAKRQIAKDDKKKEEEAKKDDAKRLEETARKERQKKQNPLTPKELKAQEKAAKSSAKHVQTQSAQSSSKHKKP